MAAHNATTGFLPELSFYTMYNKFNTDPTIVDLRSQAAFEALHLFRVARMDIEGSKEELAVALEDIVANYSDNFRNIIFIVNDEWTSDIQSKFLFAITKLQRPFAQMWVFRQMSQLFEFAPLLFNTGCGGVPTFLECLLPAHIFLGGDWHADPFFVHPLRIDKILNITPSRPVIPDITHNFPIDDDECEDITPILNETEKLLHAYTSEHKRILVHCHQGVSRSVTVILNFIMALKQMDPDAALQALRANRPQALPNSSFMLQLRRRWQERHMPS
jgi:hypothetical protein